MKTSKLILAGIAFSLSLFSYACNNVGYEIETTEDENPSVYPVDSETHNQPFVQNTANTANSNSPSAANDETAITKSGKSYTIQIGAFSNELSAQDYSYNARTSLNLDVNYLKIGELYKIRVGTFTSISEALVALDNIRQNGYKDSFISEINK